MKKSIISRMLYVVIATIVASLYMLSMTAMSVSAVEIAETPEVSVSEENDAPENNMVRMDATSKMASNVTILAGNPVASSSGSAGADSSYQKVVTFFVTWIRRIGALVALVGAVMFGLAIKNNDAEQKQSGLLTMVAGFVVVAITSAVDMFDLFT